MSKGGAETNAPSLFFSDLEFRNMPPARSWELRSIA
jgi:hypothetical protein